jgi:hypothetical protein
MYTLAPLKPYPKKYKLMSCLNEFSLKPILPDWQNVKPNEKALTPSKP